MLNFLARFRLNYSVAKESAGLVINDVGKSHLLLKWAQLSDKRYDDIKLKVDGDFTRFEEIYALLSRMAKGEASGHASHSHSHNLQYPTYHTSEHYPDDDYAYDWDNPHWHPNYHIADDDAPYIYDYWSEEYIPDTA